MTAFPEFGHFTRIEMRLHFDGGEVQKKTCAYIWVHFKRHQMVEIYLESPATGCLKLVVWTLKTRVFDFLLLSINLYWSYLTLGHKKHSIFGY